MLGPPAFASPSPWKCRRRVSWLRFAATCLAWAFLANLSLRRALVRFSSVATSGTPPAAKLLHFVRHAQGTHNVDGNYRSPENLDARLTSSGEQQCRDLARRTQNLSLELVISSPLTRTLQTAQLSFAAALQRGVPLIAEESARETVNYLCDCRRPITQLRTEFSGVDFSRIDSEQDPIWDKYEQLHGDHEAFPFYRESNDLEALGARKANLLSFVDARSEKNIAIVSHAAFLAHMFNATAGLYKYGDNAVKELMQQPWRNCEMRTVVAEFNG